MNDSTAQPIIMMGASAGGVNAIHELASTLPRNFAAPILFVQHIGAHRSELSRLVSAREPNLALTASDGDVPRPGTIHIAPPDQHIVLDGPTIRLSRGPKEHHARPVINPLFRSAALSCGPRAIGVVLTGMLDDGSAGLRAIKDCGGTAVVQDPTDADAPDMPRSALAYGETDHVVPLAALGPLLYDLAKHPGVIDMPQPPTALRQEHVVSNGGNALQTLKTIASPSVFTCPDCGGVPFELNDKRPIRYRCHTGHAFSQRSLAYMQEEMSDAPLWPSLRMLQEKEAVLRRQAQAQAQEATMLDVARDALRKADTITDLRKANLGLPKSTLGI